MKRHEEEKASALASIDRARDKAFGTETRSPAVETQAPATVTTDSRRGVQIDRVGEVGT